MGKVTHVFAGLYEARAGAVVKCGDEYIAVRSDASLPLVGNDNYCKHCRFKDEGRGPVCHNGYCCGPHRKHIGGGVYFESIPGPGAPEVK